MKNQKKSLLKAILGKSKVVFISGFLSLFILLGTSSALAATAPSGEVDGGTFMNLLKGIMWDDFIWDESGNLIINDGNSTPLLIPAVNSTRTLSDQLKAITVITKDGKVAIGKTGINSVADADLATITSTLEVFGDLRIGDYVLPSTDGTNGQVLTTNGAGAVAWRTGGGSGSLPTCADGEILQYNGTSSAWECVANAGGSGTCILQSQEFTTPGTTTFTVPAGVTEVYVTATGAGGAGGSGYHISTPSTYSGGGGGGGGGECVIDQLITGLVPGSTINLSIGNNIGTSGDRISSFGSYITVNGGGDGGNGGDSIGGAAGVAGGNGGGIGGIGNDGGYYGGDGGNVGVYAGGSGGDWNSTGSGGGGGGAGCFGGGGGGGGGGYDSFDSDSAGDSAGAGGGGAGGGVGNNYLVSDTGSLGGFGAVIVKWADSSCGGSGSLPTCADGEILQYNGTSSAWECVVSAGGSGNTCSGTPGPETFYSSRTFTVPAGVTEVYVTAIGGGGGGGGGGGHGATTRAGGGGGSGAGIENKLITGLTPGETINVTVGSGGSGGIVAYAGNILLGIPASAAVPADNGGNSSFGNYITINGGTGGINADYSTIGYGGAGGTTTDSASVVGLDGSNGYAQDYTSMPGGAGGDSSIIPDNGNSYGLGGEGGGATYQITGTPGNEGYLITGYNGEFGTKGAVIVDWNCGGSSGSSVWDIVTGGISYAAGNVGIGTTTPEGNLHIKNPNSDSARIFMEGTALGSQKWKIYSASDGFGIQGGDSGTNSMPKLIIADNGNIGIGASSASTGLKLDVEGKVGATEYCDQNGLNCTAAADLGGSGAALPTTCSAGEIAEFDGSTWGCVANAYVTGGLYGYCIYVVPNDGGLTYGTGMISPAYYSNNACRCNAGFTRKLTGADTYIFGETGHYYTCIKD